MKKIYVFLCVALLLFLGSCADLSMNDEEAVKADLPPGFTWEVYGEINGDVLMSQIIVDVGKTKIGADSIANVNCVDILSSDMNFAKEVYKDYLQCPVDGWNKKEKCTGKYAYNSNYSKSDTSTTITITRDTVITQISDPENPDIAMPDTTITITRDTIVEITLCAIENCWSEGWSEDKYLEAAKTGSDIIKSMCQFIPYPSTLNKAKDYLKDFKDSKFDPYLVEQHYHFFGRSDGRPYIYCGGDVKRGAEKTQSLADKRAGLNDYYYDYGRHTFCLEKTDQKIYVVVK